jgi:hypothetical protein
VLNWLNIMPWRRMGEWMYSPSDSWPRTLVGFDWSASPSGLFTPGARTPYPFDMRLGVLQSHCGCCGVEKINFPCRESNPGLPTYNPKLYRLRCPSSIAYIYFHKICLNCEGQFSIECDCWKSEITIIKLLLPLKEGSSLASFPNGWTPCVLSFEFLLVCTGLGFGGLFASDTGDIGAKHCRRRKARTVFSDHQLMGLEKRFESQRYLSTPERVELANALKLSETQVRIWWNPRKMLRNPRQGSVKADTSLSSC